LEQSNESGEEYDGQEDEKVPETPLLLENQVEHASPPPKKRGDDLLLRLHTGKMYMTCFYLTGGSVAPPKITLQVTHKPA
jgi:hypothetical protein